MSHPATTGAQGWADCLAEGRLPLFVLVCLAVWVGAADSLITATVMPSIGAELGGYAYFGWAVAAFMLGVVVACASAGRLSEIIGLGRAMVAASLVFGAGCTMTAVAPSMAVVLMGRLVQGLGGGWLSGFAMVIIGLFFPERHLARVFAAAAAVWGVATALGPLIGGLLAEAGSWRWVFGIFAIQAVLVAVVAAALLPSGHSKSDGAVPWRQLAVLAVGIAAIAWANVASAPLAAGLGTLVGLALLGLVVWIDSRAATRLLPAGAGNPRSIAGAGYAGMFALTGASVGLSAYGPAILQELQGLSPLTAGYTVASMAVTWTLCAFAVSSVEPDRERGVIRVASLLVFLGAVGLALVMPDAVPLRVAGAGAVMGAGFGLCSSLVNRRVLRTLTDEDRAIGSSALVAVRQTGGAVGAAIAGVAANMVGFDTGLSEATARRAGQWVFIVALPLAVLGVLGLFQHTRRCEPRSAPPGGRPSRDCS